MDPCKILKVNGQDWVVGLVWRSFAERPSPHEYKDDAQVLGADWVVIRETINVTQTGFCPAVRRYRPRRLYSLAAAIADGYKQPWRGIFKLNDELWWYIAVRDGQAILPDGDVAGDHEHVIAAYERHNAYGDWQTYNGTIEDLLPIIEIYQKSTKLVRFKLVSSTALWRSFWPIYVVIILAVLVFFIDRHFEHMRRIDQQRYLQSVQNEDSKIFLPLSITPSPDLWLAACGKIIKSISISEYGWIALSAQCSGNSVMVTWRRSPGATVKISPSTIFSDDGNQIIQIYKLSPLPPGRTKMVDYRQADNILYSILQEINVQADISDPVRDSNRFYAIQNVRFTLPVSPFEMNFNMVPGLRITSLLWTTSGWELSGDIYAK